ncbi:MAG: hypothetical protein AAGF93_15890 [Cyanobacteria bacterium P01_H01_bin.105]
MKTLLRAFAIIITSTAIPISVYLAGLENPTDIQKQFGLIANIITASVTTVTFERFFESLDDDPDDKN